MKYIAWVLIAIGLITVVVSLIMGTINMASQTAEGREKSNKWMRYRIYGQVVGIAGLGLGFALMSMDAD